MKNIQKHLPPVELLLVLGLAYVFLWFGYEKIFVTELWEGWMPMWLEGFLGLSKTLWTQILGTIEIILGLGILFPKTRFVSAVLIFANLLVVVWITRLSDVGIRDTGLLLMALALVSSTSKN